MPLAEATRLLEAFKAEAAKKDYAGARKTLNQLKLKLTELPSLPPLFGESPTAKQELGVAREALETAVLLDAAAGDDAAFERDATQLGPYYTDARPLLPASAREGQVRGLILLRLLVQNRVADFHAELARAPAEVRAAPAVAHVAALEAWMAEGAYNQVLAAGRAPPDPAAAPLLGKLLATVRDEVAACCERAYGSMPVADARRMLMLDSDADLAVLAGNRGWVLDGGRVRFPAADGEGGALRDAPPGPELVAQVLTYARELERIV